MNKDALKRLIAARAGLLLDEPFWGVPALRLQPVEDPSCETAWVNGKTLGYNPTFILECSMAELRFMWVHEVWHCAMGHPWRRDGRDQYEWNEACDRAINPTLRDAGFTLPRGVLVELAPDHVGKSAEWIHARSPKKPKLPQGSGQQEGDGDGDEEEQEGQDQGEDKQKGQGKSKGHGKSQDEGQDEGEGEGQEPQGQGKSQGQGQGTPDASQSRQRATQGGGAPSDDGSWKDFGEVRDAPAETEGQEAPPSQEDWRQIIQQAAAMARGRGKLPGSVDRAVEQATAARIDWRPAMHRFAQEVTRADYSWRHPNRRYVAHGFYMPSMRSEEVGVVAVFIDTSGSIDNVLAGQFVDAVQAMADEIKPRKIIVGAIDAAMQHVEEFERGDVIKPTLRGGGGTDFRPAFEYIEKMEEPPVCAIYLTDLDGTFPEEDPGIPTLWVTGRSDAREVPFGELLLANT